MDLNLDQNNLVSVISELPNDQLKEIILQQAALIQQLQKKITELEKQIEELKNKPPSSTAPFRKDKDKLKKNPKKSGQKKGHKGFFRKAPTPTEVIDVPLEFCPDCFCEIENRKYHTQTIEEIPEVVPQVIQIKTQSGFCKTCKKKVRSTHPLQISKAMGAASVSLGPKAKALACLLQHRFHLTKSKTCAIFKELFFIHLTRGGLVNLSHRVAEKLQPEYDRLQREIEESSHIHVDETGWYVKTVGHFLSVFTNKLLTFYKISRSRTRGLVKEILGENYKGVLVTDCLSIYDDVNQLQQKCYSHHLRSIEEGLKKIPGGVSNYLEELKLMLKSAMSLKAVQGVMSSSDFSDRIEALEGWRDRLLRLENLKEQLEPEELTVRHRLFKQRDHLFEFLRHRDVEATNNQAERQLRPAVIVRKLSCGNRTEKGARTWEILASLSVTSQQRDKSFKDLITSSIFKLPP